MIRPDPLTASCFPRGYAETDRFPLLDWRDEVGYANNPDYVPVPRGLEAPILFELKYGDVFDAGIHHYGEFYAGLEYAWDLVHGDTVPWDNRPGRVSVVARFKNAIQLKWVPA